MEINGGNDRLSILLSLLHTTNKKLIEIFRLIAFVRKPRCSGMRHSWPVHVPRELPTALIKFLSFLQRSQLIRKLALIEFRSIAGTFVAIPPGKPTNFYANRNRHRFKIRSEQLPTWTRRYLLESDARSVRKVSDH